MNYKLMEESLSELLKDASEAKDTITKLMHRIIILQRAWDKAELARHLKAEVKGDA